MDRCQAGREQDARLTLVGVTNGSVMRTKLLMQSSALFLLVLGLLLTFAPQETLARGGGGAAPLATLVAQAAGALYLGFALLNWMAKDNLIGGVYSRPVAMGNFLHFVVVAMALLRLVGGGMRMPAAVLLAVAYVVFAAWFGLVLFGSPVKGLAVGEVAGTGSATVRAEADPPLREG